MIFTRMEPEQSHRSTSKKQQLVDEEFGIIAYRRNHLTKRITLRVDEVGAVRAALPPRAPLYLVKELIESSRPEIRKVIQGYRSKKTILSDGMRIGSSHSLSIEFGETDQPSRRFAGQILRIILPRSATLDSTESQDYIAQQVRIALKREASAYLPRRLSHLASTYGFSYSKVRFGNQRGRWGSCSNNGTISLNVALMNLDTPIIDYVLLHELCHTVHMNHSKAFWDEVSRCMSDYKSMRKALKTKSPL